MTKQKHYTDLGIYVVTRHQNGISALVSQTSFRGESRGGVAKCRLFSQFLGNFPPTPPLSHHFALSEK